MPIYGFNKRRFSIISDNDIGKVAFEEISELLAFICVQVPGILGVEIFGSMAREGKGHDLDLIILVAEPNWQSFRALVNGLETIAKSDALAEGTQLSSGAARRFAAMEHILGGTLGKELQIFEADHNIPVDVFLFPQDWKGRLSELQAAFSHTDPNFMENVAKDVRSLEKMGSDD